MDSFIPFSSNTSSHENATTTGFYDLLPFSLKRRRSESLHEETTVDSISDGSLSDSSTSSNKRCFVDLPAAYLAVQHLLSANDPAAADIQPQFVSMLRGGTKSEFKKTIARCQFFKFFTESEFELLWKEVKTLYPSSRNRTTLLTDLQIAEFFERRHKEIEHVCVLDWQASTPRSSTLYIPGHIIDFHLKPIFQNQMTRHRPQDLSFNQALDFIIKKVRPENWQYLVKAFEAELSYCPPLQVEQIIGECAEKGFSDLILLTLSQNPHRSITMVNDIADYTSRKTDLAFVDSVLGLFVPWVFSLPEQVLVAKMEENNPSSLYKKLVSHWVQHQFGRYIKNVHIQKQNLRSQQQIFIDSESYIQALNFFKNMLRFSKHMITWAGRQDDQVQLLEVGLGWLKANPLLTGGLQPENTALVSLDVLQHLLAKEAPASIIMELLTALNYYDYRSSSYEATNQVWRAFLKYCDDKRLTIEQLKDLFSAVMLKFPDFADLHNRPYKDDLEEKTFLEMFLKTFASYAEVFSIPACQTLLQHFLKNNFQLLHSTTGDASKLSYKTLEIFLNLLAQGYEHASEEKKQQYMDYLMSQSFMSQHVGICAVYLILIRTMSQGSIASSSSFCDEFLLAMAQPSLLSRAPLDTVIGFLNAYKSYIAATDSSVKADDVVLSIARDIIEKNDNQLLTDYLKSMYGLSEVQAPLLFTGPRSFSPLNIHVLPRSYKPGQQTRVIYHMPESVFVKKA